MSLLALSVLPSAQATSLQVGPLERIEITKPADAFTEVPPVVLPDGRGLLLSTAWTYRCGVPQLALENDCSGAQLALTSDAHLFPPQLMPERPWRRNYQGAYAAELLGGALVTFNHAENKNEVIGSNAYQNTVERRVSVEQCWSGYHDDGVYADCAAGYNGFVTATRGDTDLGPIIWPEDGYRQRPRNYLGLRHPHSILWRGVVYVFYVDHWPGGQRAGVRVARAPVLERGRGFRVWHNGSWEPALPHGFSKRRMARFYDTKGPRSTPLFGLGKDSGNFAVARRLDGRGFLGVEQWYDDSGNIHIAIRESVDLVRWGPRIHLPLTPAPFGSFVLNYPLLLNTAGTSHSRVGSTFYILGTEGTEVNRLAVELEP